MIQQVLYGLSVTVAAHWAASHWLDVGAAVPLAGSAATGLLAALWAGRLLGRPVRRLLWDGATWMLEAAGGVRRSGHVQVMLDLGEWMLLRFDPAAAAPIWLPVRRADVGADWPALRVALYAQRSYPA